MSHAHRKLTRTWHTGPRTFKYEGVWCVVDHRTPMGVVVTWSDQEWKYECRIPKSTWAKRHEAQ